MLGFWRRRVNRRPSRGKSVGAGFESLESRRVMACTFGVKSATLTITGDGAANQVRVQESATALVASCDGVSRTYAPGTLAKVSVAAGVGDDSVTYETIEALSRSRTVAIDLGAGRDVATVQTNGQPIAATRVLDVSINGRAGDDDIDWQVDSEVDGTARLSAFGGADKDVLHAFSTARPGSTGVLTVATDGGAGNDDVTNVLLNQSGGTLVATRSLVGGLGWDHCQWTPGATVQTCEFGESFARLVPFAGQYWGVKAGAFLGPGPNHFSDSEQNVWVDAQGHAHLAINQQAGNWQSAEMVGLRPMGHGTYTWTISAPNLGSFDPNTILGLFLYRDDNNEVDFELARWGDPNNANGQFVVQPWGSDSMSRFSTGAATQLTISLTWNGTSVRGRCWEGTDTSVAPLRDWTYAGAKVSQQRMHPRMNFWLMSGLAPLNGQAHEVTLESFHFVPV